MRILLGFTASIALLLGALLNASVQAAPGHANRLHSNTRIAALGQLSYAVNVFARGTSSYFNPDAIAVDGHFVYVAYQNNTAKNGSDGRSSTVVQYRRNGQVEHIYSIVGHCDGMRLDPSSHLLWALVNNDGNPAMYTIDPQTRSIKKYVFSSAPHGGGYDDVVFTNGQAFISASNPTLNSGGINVFPAVDRVTLSGGTALLTSVLEGDASAFDINTQKIVKLNLVDPDSMSDDPAGDVILVDQAGSELVALSHPGTSGQTATRLATGTQIEDPVWATSQHGGLFIVDGKANAVYTAKTQFIPGTVYVETPNDSGVSSSSARWICQPVSLQRS
ncbi:MAG: hypothetical protein M3007_01180 [Candidatus Eremiobacteraeota bacterium]|nr:hypothetical protein [Candidatus Eremiobacteraeota bacterium]